MKTKSTFAAVAFGACVVLSSTVGNLRAATITVTNTAYNGPGTLQAAINSANNGDTINFALPMPSTIALPGGPIQVNKSLAILGPGPANLIVRGSGPDNVFYLIGPSNNITIAGLTITNGNSLYGGGIYNDECNVIVSNVVLVGNNAQNLGGGIFSSGYPNGASLTIINSAISSNTSGDEGGGIYSEFGALAISSCTLTGNAANSGGGIFQGAADPSGTARMSVVASTLHANQAFARGGAIFNLASGATPTSAAVGITNSTLSGNYASAGGAAIYNTGGGIASVAIACSTISGNTGDDSTTGAIYNIGTNNSVRVGNSIFTPGTGARNFTLLSGSIISFGFNLSSDNGGGFLTNATDQINTGALLGPLQDNGGPTYTHAPLPGSPAIDKGTNFSAAATDQRGLPRTYDKAAISNAAGGDGTDIGAVESQSYTVLNINDSGMGSLRQAIADSNAQPGTNTIDFAPSAYGTILLTSGELFITNNVLVVGPGTNNEAVDGNAASRIFHINTNSVVTIASLTITNGSASGFSGGIYNDHATLTVSNCVVSGNSGGGIFNGIFGPGSSMLNIFNSILSSNSVVGGGGGIYNNAGGGTASVQIVNSILIGNKATANTGGGGIHSAFGNGGNAIVQIVNSVISGNAATNYPGGGPGGGIYLRNSVSAGSASLTVSNSVISSNRAYSAGGGIAIFCQFPGSTATVAVVSSTLSSNSLPFGGGAIYNTSYDSSSGHGGNISLQVANCTISGNSAGAGTAISNDGHNTGGGTTRILNCTVSSNFNSSPFGTADGIDNGGNSKLEIGSTVLNNLGPNVGGSTITSLGYNLCGDTGDGFLTNATDHINTDPLLGPLQDNGGPTFTHAPLPGSPALDNGTNFSGSATDQRGFKRTLGGGDTDVGAVQSQDMSIRLVKAGVVSNQFGFRLVGPFTNVVVEASTNVSGSNWTALATNTLGDAVSRFNDPGTPTLPKRFYRARVQH